MGPKLSDSVRMLADMLTVCAVARLEGVESGEARRLLLRLPMTTNLRDEGTVPLQVIGVALSGLAQEVRTMPRAATMDDGLVFLRRKPDRRRTPGTVLPYRERRAVRR